jgi:hypothetical protein
MSLRSSTRRVGGPSKLVPGVGSIHQLLILLGEVWLTSTGDWRNLDPFCGEAGDKTKGAGGVLSTLSSTELGLDTSSISTSRNGAHMMVIGMGVLIILVQVPGNALRHTLLR